MVEIRCLPIACSLMARLWHFYQHGWYHYEPYWSLRKISISISLTFSFPMLKVPYCAINHPQVVPCQPFCWTFVLGVPTSPIFKRLMKKVLVSNSQLRLKNRSTKSQTNQLHLFFSSCSKFIKVQWSTHFSSPGSPYHACKGDRVLRSPTSSQNGIPDVSGSVQVLNFSGQKMRKPSGLQQMAGIAIDHIISPTWKTWKLPGNSVHRLPNDESWRDVIRKWCDWKSGAIYLRKVWREECS